ncbi:MAG TPA: DUF3530 family protein [Pseudomonadales bacterium]|nr:DUF3530 family protein [Pseudomonadales bacterium]
MGGTADDETRTLNAAGGEFTTLVRTAQGTPHGTLVLLPADGAHPEAGEAMERLRRDLPAHGWTTWLITLDPPPGIRSGRIDPDAQQEPSQPTADAGHAEALARWAEHGEARITATLTAARAENPTVVLAAAGPAAVLLLHALPDATAALLIEAVELPDLALAWPQPLPVPVMEILRPALAIQRPPPARDSSDQEAARRYRRLLIDVANVEPFGVETLLTRRVRGWLSTMRAAPAAAAAD